jgi:MFS family permease
VKKAFVIVSVVIVYCLLETSLLLGLMLPFPHPGPSPFQSAVLFGQLLLIPGIAVLLSRAMYGPNGRRRRVLGILAVGAVGVPAAIGLLVALALIADWVSSITSSSSITTVVFVVLLLLVGGSIALRLFKLVRKAAQRNIQIEADNWLVNRRSGMDSSERRWKLRGILAASWIPSLMVLLVFLFLPEVWGVLSHAVQPRAGQLPGYRVAIPITWIVLNYEEQPIDGRAWVTGLAGRGMGRGVTPYLDIDLPLSEWTIGTKQYNESRGPETLPRIPKEAPVVEQRAVRIGSANVTCVKYPSPYQGWNIKNSSTVFVSCSGAGRVYASFVGKDIHVLTFYSMLEGMTALD